MARRRRHSIATLREGPLHAALKEWCLRPGDRSELPVDGRQIDVVRGELLIEIQTASFGAIRDKLAALLERHPVRLVHPVAAERWIVRVDGDGNPVGRRKSPKRRKVEDVFDEAVSLPTLLLHPRFSLEVVLVREEEVRRQEPGRAWRRRGWVVVERRLLEVIGSHRLEGEDDYLRLLPSDLPDAFTTADLAERLEIPRALAQKMAYCFRRAGLVRIDGKRGNSLVYCVSETAELGRRQML